MIGIIFLAFIAFWFLCSIFFVNYVCGLLKKEIRTAPLCVLIWVFVFILPVLDDIVGKFQFQKICKAGSYFEINAKEISGKKVISVVEEKEIQNFPIRIVLKKFSYRDLDSNKELASFTRYEAEGGWLARLIEFNKKGPWTFDGVCDSSPQKNFNFEIVRE